MSHSTTAHRSIEIKYGYDITTDSYRANFILPEERRSQLGFQQVVRINPPAGIRSGKNHAVGNSEGEALALARLMIDNYLDNT